MKQKNEGELWKVGQNGVNEIKYGKIWQNDIKLGKMKKILGDIRQNWDKKEKKRSINGPKYAKKVKM